MELLGVTLPVEEELAHLHAAAEGLCHMDCWGAALALGQGSVEGLPEAEGVVESLAGIVADGEAEEWQLAEARAVPDATDAESAPVAVGRVEAAAAALLLLLASAGGVGETAGESEGTPVGDWQWLED